MLKNREIKGRRVILAFWKGLKLNRFEVFSNLRLFCLSYPEYSYNTLNNYLSKGKVPFENEMVRIERKQVLNRVIEPAVRPAGFRLEPVVRRTTLHRLHEKEDDLAYWLSRDSAERIAAVTFLVSQATRVGAILDKSMVSKKKLKDDDIE